MSMSLNRVQLIGNLTRDPELRQIPGGQVVATFGVATNFSWKDQSGQQQTRADFHNVVVWRKLAEICAQYLKKGSKVFIEGRLQTREWEGEDGVKRYRTEIVVDNMIMLDSRGAAMDNGERENRGLAGESNESAKSFESGTSGGAPVPSEVSAGNSGDDSVNLDDLPF